MQVGDSLPPFGDVLTWLDERPSAMGSPTLVYFWSISCGSCHANMPALHELRDRYAAHGLQVVAVHMPRGEAELDVAKVRVVADELGITEPCTLDSDHALTDAFGVTAVPTYFLFGADGTLKRHAKGAFGAKLMASALERLFPDPTA